MEVDYGYLWFHYYWPILSSMMSKVGGRIGVVFVMDLIRLLIPSPKTGLMISVGFNHTTNINTILETGGLQRQ